MMILLHFAIQFALQFSLFTSFRISCLNPTSSILLRHALRAQEQSIQNNAVEYTTLNKNTSNFRILLKSNDSAFLPFPGMVKLLSYPIHCYIVGLVGSDKLGYIVEEEQLNSVTLQKRTFLPEELSSNSDPMHVWNWWERRRKSERQLKRAIASEEVS